MARSQLDEVASAAKDAAFVSVGLGVLAFQRLQVRRNDLAKVLAGEAPPQGPVDLLASLVGEQVKLVEERLSAAVERATRR